jgi:hypothetical protein
MNDPVTDLFQIAPTLAELRKLPADQKDRVLLSKLARMSRHNTSVLNEHNLMLPGDPYGLAQGFPDAEKHGVKEHLLGAPWTRLVNEGHLVDLTGQGFHKVSVEGHEYLAEPEKPVTASVTPVAVGAVPRAFISYSWDGVDHQAWVAEFAHRLQGESGIEVIFDKWGLQPGGDKQHFMEQAVTAHNFVIIVCTEAYAARANNRKGGVGFETMVITGEMADDMRSEKFIPVLRQGTFETSLPKYIKTKMGIDLSARPYLEDEYDRLIRVLHGEPIQGPPIGPKPDFSKKIAKFVAMTPDADENPTDAFHAAEHLVESKAGEAFAQFCKGTFLDALNERPNAVLHAQYDKPGTPGPWLHAIVRGWEINGEAKYSLENSQGDEFLGTKDDVISMFSNFDRKLIKEGYKRMSFGPGPDTEFQSL